MRIFTTTLLCAALHFTALAQTTAPSSPLSAASDSTAAKKMDSKDMAEAEVRKVDRDAKKITLKHGPIKNLDMPGMTMVFQVKNSALLDKLAAGDKIMFTAEQQQGAFVLTGAEKVVTK
jgi:Cu(I)/Ag(I) efflux system periplasmic protein CusF